MLLFVAAFWLWEAVISRNDFTRRQSRPLWHYWMVPLAMLAFW
jgi:hypothetical protein